VLHTRQKLHSPPATARGGNSNRSDSDASGQSAVELALVTPIILLLLLWIAQFGLLFAQQITLVHVSRETARAVALHNSAEIAREAALASSSLVEDNLTVEVLGNASPGKTFTVKITYDAPTEVPLVGKLLGNVTLTSQTSMRSES